MRCARESALKYAQGRRVVSKAVGAAVVCLFASNRIGKLALARVLHARRLNLRLELGRVDRCSRLVGLHFLEQSETLQQSSILDTSGSRLSLP